MLRLDGRRSLLEVHHAVATVAPGQGGLETLRLDVRFGATLPSTSGRLSFVDRNDPGRLGWREVVARGADGMALVGSDVPTASVTDGLRTYPEDLLSAPPDVGSMRARFGPGPGAPPASTSTGSAGPAAVPGVLDRLLGRSGAIVLVLGVLVALALGAWHALLPGHGKTLMAAAVVGADPRPRDAVVAGLAVAGMHTFSVIGLALVVMVLEQTFRPEAVYPWLRAAAGVTAVGVGVHLVRRRWPSEANAATRPDRDHDHDGRHHRHAHAVPAGSFSRPGLAALAFAGGILPSPSALLVVLASVQRGRAVYGLALVLAFSVGLATSLILVALGAMRARHLVTRRSTSVLARSLPVASAFAVVAIGLVVAGGAVASL